MKVPAWIAVVLGAMTARAVAAGVTAGLAACGTCIEVDIEFSAPKDRLTPAPIQELVNDAKCAIDSDCYQPDEDPPAGAWGTF